MHNIVSSIDTIFPLPFGDPKFRFVYGREDEIEQLKTRFWGEEATQTEIDHCVIQVYIAYDAPFIRLRL